MASEPFSWAKFFSGLTTVVGWAKFASFWLKVALIAVPLVSGYFAYRYVYNQGYSKGQIVMRDIKEREFRQWIADHPQQNISGSTVNNNVQQKQNHFQFKIIPPLIGWCE